MHARLFGKLPAHGDFVCRGFAPAERDACDRWLSHSLAQARAAYGPHFEQRYDAALPWRFATENGTGAGSGGALALSQDAAGRRYPILLQLTLVAASHAVAGRVEALLYDAIVGRWNADALADAAAALDGFANDAPAPAPAHWWRPHGGGGAVADGDTPPDLLTRMLAVEAGA